MVSSKKLNIVLDIGKTNVKLTFVDSTNNKTIKFFNTKQKNIYRHGIKILNSNSIPSVSFLFLMIIFSYFN